jgi:hypothetical protein
MLVGHYSTAFMGKAAARTVPLWVLVFAVQLVDVAWSILVLLGVEKVRITPGFMEMSPFDLYHMPYTHSLEATAGWAVAAGAVYMLARRGAGLWGGAIVAAAVFSHWLLDLIVHTKDLPILLTGEKVGLGLWDNLPAAMGLELGLLALGFVFYMRVTTPAAPMGRVTPWLLLGFLVILQFYIVFAPPPGSAQQLAVMALTSYLAATGLAFWADRTRIAK